MELNDMVFGRLTVIGKHKSSIPRRTYWTCKCTCGKKSKVLQESLTSGRTKSCGCRQNTGDANRKHNMCYTRFYNIYRHIKSRTCNPKNQDYARYGGRGIKNNWQSFSDFKKDMHESYLRHVTQFGEKDTQIDRYPNNNGHYSKDNTRWATQKEQAWNKIGKPFSGTRFYE